MGGVDVASGFALVVLRVPLFIRARFVEENAPGIAIEV
jgi:hypothetical protein